MSPRRENLLFLFSLLGMSNRSGFCWGNLGSSKKKEQELFNVILVIYSAQYFFHKINKKGNILWEIIRMVFRRLSF